MAKMLLLSANTRLHSHILQDVSLESTVHSNQQHKWLEYIGHTARAWGCSGVLVNEVAEEECVCGGAQGSWAQALTIVCLKLLRAPYPAPAKVPLKVDGQRS